VEPAGDGEQPHPRVGYIQGSAPASSHATEVGARHSRFEGLKLVDIEHHV
jgi:hypothetical protein